METIRRSLVFAQLVRLPEAPESMTGVYKIRCMSGINILSGRNCVQAVREWDGFLQERPISWRQSYVNRLCSRKQNRLLFIELSYPTAFWNSAAGSSMEPQKSGIIMLINFIYLFIKFFVIHAENGPMASFLRKLTLGLLSSFCNLVRNLLCENRTSREIWEVVKFLWWGIYLFYFREEILVSSLKISEELDWIASKIFWNNHVRKFSRFSKNSYFIKLVLHSIFSLVISPHSINYKICSILNNKVCILVCDNGDLWSYFIF